MLPRVLHVPPAWRRDSLTCAVEVSSESSESDSSDSPPLKAQCVRRRRSHIAAALLGVSPHEYRNLKRLLVPRDFLQVLCGHHLDNGWLSQHLQLVDWFCGLGEIEQAGIRHGLETLGYEILRDLELMNFVCDPGYLSAIGVGKQMKIEALSHWGIVCSSWIWAVRNVTKRSCSRPMGDPSVIQTHWGNMMVLRFFLIFVLRLLTSLYKLSMLCLLLCLCLPVSYCCCQHPFF